MAAELNRREVGGVLLRFTHPDANYRSATRTVLVPTADGGAVTGAVAVTWSERTQATGVTADRMTLYSLTHTRNSASVRIETDDANRRCDPAGLGAAEQALGRLSGEAQAAAVQLQERPR